MGATELGYENRDVAYALIAPLYGVLARFVPAWVSPNALTLLGLGCAAAMLVVMLAWSSPQACLVGALLVLGYEVFDSLDGKHARNTGQSSRFGAYLDTAVDGLAAGLIYTGVVGHFQLFTPIFLLAIGVRMAKACFVYASAAETRLRINPEIGTTVENLLVATLLLWQWASPGAGIDVGAWASGSPWLQHALQAFQLDFLSPIRTGLFLLVLGLPLTSLGDVLEVKRLLEADQAGTSAG